MEKPVETVGIRRLVIRHDKRAFDSVARQFLGEGVLEDAIGEVNSGQIADERHVSPGAEHLVPQTLHASYGTRAGPAAGPRLFS